MAFCNNCGTQVSEDTKFCASCGQPVSADESAQVDGAQVQAQPEQQAQQEQAQAQPQAQQQAPAAAPSATPGESAIDKLKTVIENTADETSLYDPADIEKNKTMSGLAYILFFLPLVACPDSKYGRFHANQGLIVLILGIAAGIVVNVITSIIPRQLGLISTLISSIVYLVVFAIGILGLINGFSGKAKELPFIGKFRIIK